jgi:hypothetical protein
MFLNARQVYAVKVAVSNDVMSQGREKWAKEKTDPFTCEHASHIAPLQNSDDNLLWENVEDRCIGR